MMIILGVGASSRKGVLEEGTRSAHRDTYLPKRPTFEDSKTEEEHQNIVS